jgi:hypothetical protein
MAAYYTLPPGNIIAAETLVMAPFSLVPWCLCAFCAFVKPIRRPNREIRDSRIPGLSARICARGIDGLMEIRQ